MTYIMDFYGTLFEIFIYFCAIVVVPGLAMSLVYCFVMMIRSQAEADRGIRSRQWVNMVKRERKKRAKHKRATECETVESRTWTT
jgi:hypothetical protein